MNKLTQTFDEFLVGQSPDIQLLPFLLNLIVAALLSGILSYFYVRFGFSISNRRLFARNFIMIATTTMLIISIVKSSLALSLGLVGALSIIRFRTAIKEPEELAYLFLNIAIGLGLGASQVKTTVTAFVVILLIVYIRGRFTKKEEFKQLMVSVMIDNPGDGALGRVSDTLKKYCSTVDLKRFDSGDSRFEGIFTVDFNQISAVEDAGKDLSGTFPGLKFSFLDNNRV